MYTRIAALNRIGTKICIFLISILLFFPNQVFSQINFSITSCDSSRNILYKKADSAILSKEFGEIHSLVIIENGSLIFERYYCGWTHDSVHQLQSATKSVVATLLGCAIQQKLITRTSSSINNYFPQSYLKGVYKNSISVEHLLTQQHGLKWNELDFGSENNSWRRILSTQGDWYKSILQTPMDTTPGTIFNYSNAAPVLIVGIIQIASKMPIDKFAERYLFEPLNIQKYKFWEGNGGPQNNGMALLYLTSRDMAKLGQLYLQNGQWNNVQILPADYIKDAISPKVRNVGANGIYSGYDYGYFWWINPVWKQLKQGQMIPNIFLARGAGGQNIIIWPEKKIVVVITGWNIDKPNKPEEIFDKYIAY